MTSILTNISAMTALQTLRSVGAGLSSEQMQVSTGLRVSKASDDVAYWSISTSMRSDQGAVSAANDALGVGAAKVDTAYAAMTSVVEALSEFKAKLVGAKEEGMDTDKIQADLDQIKAQVVAISQAASFNGENWLNTSVEDIYDPDQNKVSVVSGFTRNANGSTSIAKTEHSVQQSSLFNSTGGGILQADPRDLKTIGGLRFDRGSGTMTNYSLRNTGGWGPSDFTFDFSSPITLGPGDSIGFDVTVDQDNPADGLSAPYDPGQTTSIVIDAAMVNSALGRSDGTIGDYKDYAAVLRRALAGSGLTATTYTKYDPPGQTSTWVNIPDVVGIVHYGLSTKDGSSMAISNIAFNGVTQANQIAATSVSYGTWQASMSLDFEPFTVYQDVIVGLRLRVNGSNTNLSFDKAFVDAALGKDNGKVETADEMATLMTALTNRPDLIVTSNGSNSVTLTSDILQNRKSGEKSSIGIYNIDVSIEPLPTLNFMDIDIVQNPDMIDGYISYIEAASGRAVGGAASLGALQSAIEMQDAFAKTMMDTLDKGISRLVDADMEEASARLNALQSQQRLAVQSLQMANNSSSAILTLFNA